MAAAAALGYEKGTPRRFAGALCARLGVFVGYPSGYWQEWQPFFNFGDAIVLFTTVLLALFDSYAGKMLLCYRASTIDPIATMGGVGSGSFAAMVVGD